MSDQPHPNPLDTWTAAEKQRSGLDDAGQVTQAARAGAGKPQLLPSPGLAGWLADSGGSLAYTTYQTGRLFFLGSDPDGALYAHERQMGSAMGLAIDADKLWVGGRDRIWRLSNTGADQIDGQQYDAIYMPRTNYLIGRSNTHDVIADVSFGGTHYPLLYANTEFSCVAAPDEHYTFRPVWAPDFISALAPGDRCHLNGICARDGELAYATACARTDTAMGWRDGKSGGGVVIDTASGEVVCGGLSMPHSPRWHQGKLWLINSGEAQLGYVDLARRAFVPVAMCQGFARGLAFVGKYAVVGLSRLREQSGGMVGSINLLERLAAHGYYQRCGLLVIDLETGRPAHWLTIEGQVTELFDVAFLAGLRRPYTPGFREPEQHLWRISLPPGKWEGSGRAH